MKMKSKKHLLVVLSAFLIVFITSASAVDANDADIASIDESTDIVNEKLALDSSSDTLSVSNDSNVLGNDEHINEGNGGTFTELQANITQSASGSTLTLTKNYEYDDGFATDGILIDKTLTIDGQGHKIDAQGKSRIFKITAENVILKNIHFINGNTTNQGGAVHFEKSGTVTDCNFTDNMVNGDNRYGGAITMSSGRIEKCNFINNSANMYGGAIYFENKGNLSNCTFIDNKVTSARGYGGAVYFNTNGTVENCTFTGNRVIGATSRGGAIRMDSGNVTNCNFTNNSATYGGGAIFFSSTKYSGKVENCNFNSNSGRLKGGAIYFSSTTSPSTAINCNFTNNTANDSNGNGGAINMYSGSVENCNFNSNTAGLRGGAIYFDRAGNVTNCNFTNNKATHSTCKGGAVYFYNRGNVANCNFTDNSATNLGGAIYFETAGTVANCNFTGNNATSGSAIYFFGTSAIKAIYNSTFLNNRASSEDLEVIINENNITITFTGKDNLLNAIYSRNNAEVIFTNVTYWSANGITNTGSLPATPSRSFKEAGQNITVNVVVNDEIVLSDVKVTDKNGMTILNISVGDNYFIGVRHDADSYYIEAVKTISNNTKFNVNIISQTTDSRAVNITAKSNIPNEVINGKLLFIITNSAPLVANYAGNGTWWVLHTFDNCGEFEVNASFEGLDNVTISNATITLNKIETKLFTNPVTTTYNVNKYLIITLNDVYGNPLSSEGITVDLGSVKTYITDKNGQIRIPTKPLAAKTYTAKITFNGNDFYLKSSNAIMVTVNKAANPLKIKAKAIKVKFSKLKKKTLKLKVTKVVKFTKKGQGTLTYKKIKGNKKITINKKTGKITIKKGLKKGTYKVKIKIKAKGNGNYKASAFKKITFKIKVK